MTEYYIIDKTTGEIVNCVTSAKKLPEVEASFENIWPGSRYRFDPNPPLSALQRYRYWNERP